MSKAKIVLLAVGVFVGWIWLAGYRNVPPLSNSAHKVVHVSFDDVVSVFKDLKKDSLSYGSVFEHAFLKELKELHDKYGACFSLYVFERDGDFHISEVPIRFREEFKGNADWLKFGFHWTGPRFESDIRLKDFANSYRSVNESIMRWGDTSCLSPVIRLHYFYGADSLVEFINRSGRVNGLLCADDERNSYDLSSSENEILRQNRFYEKGGMKYFKTDLRYENCGFIYPTLARLQNRDTLVVFTHEWAWRPQSLRQWGSGLLRGQLAMNWWNRYKLRASVKWFHEHGYKFGFLE